MVYGYGVRHNDIKRLKRENEHLRREIWTLREELYRLEHEHESDHGGEEEDRDEDEDTVEEDEEETDEEYGDEEETKKTFSDQLSTVNEEPEDYTSTFETFLPSTPTRSTFQQVDVTIEEIPPTSTSPAPLQNPSNEGRLEEYKLPPPACLRIHSIHPFTAAASIDPYILPNLSACEVIEEVTKTCGGIIGVRMLHRSVFLSCANRQCLDDLLAAGLTLRDTPIALHDVSHGTVVVALSGVPHHLSDSDLAQILAQYGPVISGVERRLFRDVDTGERLARLRPVSSLPKRVFIQGSEVLMRPLTHEELSKLSIQSTAPKPNLQLKIDTSGTSEGNEPTTQGSTSTPSAHKSEPIFPNLPPSPNNNLRTPPLGTDDRSHSVPTVGAGFSTPLIQPRKIHSDPESKKEKPRIRRVSRKMSRQEPSSSSEQESPNKPQRRRRSSVFVPPGFGFDGGRDRSASLSSRASLRRKMSVTGRETGKIPWCACWGNGCF